LTIVKRLSSRGVTRKYWHMNSGPKSDTTARQNISQWENGFISILENVDLQLGNIQIGGRSEILVGTIESLDAMLRINFVSKTLSNDPRMISSARTFELEGDTLRYDMEMQTTKVNQSTPHLKIVLQRIK